MHCTELSCMNRPGMDQKSACLVVINLIFFAHVKTGVVQDHLGQINKTHLRELLKDNECCAGMIKYIQIFQANLLKKVVEDFR